MRHTNADRASHRWHSVYLLPVTVLVLVIVVFSWEAWFDRAQIIESAQDDLELRSRNVQVSLTGLLTLIDGELGAIAETCRATAHEKIPVDLALGERLLRLQRSSPIAALFVLDTNGRVEFHSDPSLRGRDDSRRDHFRVHPGHLDADEGLFLGKPFVADGGKTAVVASRAIHDTDGRRIGVAAAAISLDALAGKLLQPTDPPELVIVLIDRDGTILLRRPDSGQSAGRNVGESLPISAHRKGGQTVSRHMLSTTPIDGVSRLASLRDLGMNGLTIVVARDTDDILAKWHRELRLRTAALALLAIAMGFLARVVHIRQREAQQVSALYSAVVRNTTDVIMIFGQDGRVSYVSPSVADVTGFPADRGLGMHFHTFAHRDDHEQVDAAWNRLLQVPGHSQRIHFRVKHAAGHWVHVEALASSHFDTEGIHGALLVARDVTQRVVAEEHLRRSEETLLRAQAVAHLGSWYFDNRTRELTWSDETYRICGILPGTPMTPRTFWEIVHPDDRDMLHNEWIAAKSGEAFDCGHRILVGGNVVWVHERADILFDDEGRMLSCTGTVQDVTAQQLAAMQLSELLDFTEKIIAESPVGIAVFHADGPCVMANESMARITGATLEQARAQNFRRLDSWRDMGLLDAAIEALQTGKPVGKVANGVSSYGATVALDCEFAAITRQGEQHLLLLANDIAELKAAERALQEATHLAQEASRAKSEFLANMSHEIRTPMNAVIGLAQLALNHTSDPTLRDYLRQMFDSGTALLRIINNILDYSKIEAGELDLEEQEFSPRELAESMVRMFRVAADTKGLSLDSAIDADVPGLLGGDSLRLGQVLTNLVGNAIKFTDHGSVRMRIEQVAPASPTHARCRLRFTVRDSGVGIPPGSMNQLFQPFVQADGSITRRYGGTGLGLSISRRLVLMMGGDIAVDSSPGTGSSFSFELDFPVIAADALPPRHDAATAPSEFISAAAPLAGAHVLLVEDDQVNRRVISGLLRNAGLDVTTAAHGGEAMVELGHAEFDAILMDLQMPVMDGFEATRRIRAQPIWAPIPIIAVTASALGDTRERCLAIGMNDFLTKPVRPSELISALLRHVPSRVRSGQAGDAATLDPAAEAITTSRVRAHLVRLAERLANNEFISAVELAQLCAVLGSLALDPGSRLETAISHYDYTSAKTLLAGMVATLGGQAAAGNEERNAEP